MRFHGAKDCIYAGWVTSEGDIVVAQLEAERPTVTHVVHQGLDKNDHASPALFVDPSGFVTAYYSAHNGSAIFSRTTESPEDITHWQPEIELVLNRGSAERNAYTYPTPLEVDHELYLVWRGDFWKPTMARRTGATEWTAAETLVMRPGAPSTNRPYFKAVSDGSSFHFAVTDGHPATEPHNSIYYFRRQGDTFLDVRGRSIGRPAEPLNPADADVVFDAPANDHGGWIWDIALDEDGSPVLTYATFPRDDQHLLCWSKWDGSRWVTREVPARGGWFPEDPPEGRQTEPYYSGGVVLDHEDPHTMFLSRKTGARFEIEEWRTEDGGQTWVSRPVTAWSSAHNVRPVAIRNHGGDGPRLMWMRLDGWYRGYKDYRTSILVEDPRFEAKRVMSRWMDEKQRP
ncbi:MAG TPA: BNR-4 repeat-containing protein [Acidimicrobiia bacterium]